MWDEGSNPLGETIFTSMSNIGMNSDTDIGTLPISELRFSGRHICLQYWNNRCRCWMADISDIKIDVDAHLCLCLIESAGATHAPAHSIIEDWIRS
jgi:hypothetical protein